jgi:hypothetical protein
MTSTSTPTSAERQTALAQIVYKVQVERPRLMSEQEAHRQEIAQNEAELAVIQDRMLMRQQGLALLREQEARARSAHKEAKAYANVAQGTRGEIEAVKALGQAEEHLVQAQHTLNETEEQTRHADELAHGQQETLQKRIDELQEQITAKSRRLDDLTIAEAKARRELGESLFQEAMSKLQQSTEQLTAKRAEVVDLQLSQQRIIADVLEHLGDWPVYQMQVREQYAPFEDAATRCLEDGLRYIDRLLADGGVLPTALLQKLEIPGNELWSYEHLSGNPTYLKRRRQQWEQILRAHRQANQR